MSELANYSIETDQTVLLSFTDGRRLRVPMDQLRRYLAPHDLQKITSAIKLRQEFLRRHMPRAVIILIVGGVMALLFAGGRAVAHLWRPPWSVAPAPASSTVVRSLNPPSPTLSPAPAPSAEGSTTVAAAPLKPALRPRRPVANRPALKPAPLIPPVVSNALPVPSPLPLPIVLPDAPVPTPNVGLPAPSPLPVPTPPAGQVLGDATGPSTP
ncbi:MAG: hypothetical protein JWN01_468 [Patescibacteria group bacterium]|nr:hypothetical protein [Patescibacteria group bacterium]